MKSHRTILRYLLALSVLISAALMSSCDDNKNDSTLYAQRRAKQLIGEWHVASIYNGFGSRPIILHRNGQIVPESEWSRSIQCYQGNFFPKSVLNDATLADTVAKLDENIINTAKWLRELSLTIDYKQGDNSGTKLVFTFTSPDSTYVAEASVEAASSENEPKIMFGKGVLPTLQNNAWRDMGNLSRFIARARIEPTNFYFLKILFDLGAQFSVNNGLMGTYEAYNRIGDEHLMMDSLYVESTPGKKHPKDNLDVSWSVRFAKKVE